MPQSLAQVYLHLVWSTKNRIPFLKDVAIPSKWVKAREFRRMLKKYNVEYDEKYIWD